MYSGSDETSASGTGAEYCEYACQPSAPSTAPTRTFFKGYYRKARGNLTPKLSGELPTFRTQAPQRERSER